MTEPTTHTLYCLARNAVTGLRELKTSTQDSAAEFETRLQQTGFIALVVFSENDYRRVVNKRTLRGPLALTSREIHIYDTYEDIVRGHYGTPPKGV